MHFTHRSVLCGPFFVTQIKSFERLTMRKMFSIPLRLNAMMKFDIFFCSALRSLWYLKENYLIRSIHFNSIQRLLHLCQLNGIEMEVGRLPVGRMPHMQF